MYWCPGPGATGAVGLLGGGDPVLIVDGPAAVRLPELWLGHVYPADPVRLANVHLSPFRCLLAKSNPSVHQRMVPRSPQRRRRAGRNTHGVGCDPGCGCYGSSRLSGSSPRRAACAPSRRDGVRSRPPSWENDDFNACQTTNAPLSASTCTYAPGSRVTCRELEFTAEWR